MIYRIQESFLLVATGRSTRLQGGKPIQGLVSSEEPQTTPGERLVIE